MNLLAGNWRGVNRRGQNVQRQAAFKWLAMFCPLVLILWRKLSAALSLAIQTCRNGQGKRAGELSSGRKPGANVARLVWLVLCLARRLALLMRRLAWCR